MVDLWYTENHTKNARFSFRVDRQLVSRTSPYQEIAVFETPEFGRVLTLDGFVMVTERDEFIYHEMITHVPMAVNPDARQVLVIGAGDGGTVRELVRYPDIRHIDMVEIDRAVVETCREYLPSIAAGFDDPRLELHFEDGMKFIRTRCDEYDLIIVDSTDPFGPGEGLFTREFYGNCFRALRENGIVTNQHESAFYRNDAVAMQRAHYRIRSVFPVSRVYQAHIPTYPSGHWLFGFASKGADPIEGLQADRWNALGIATRYYNTKLHTGSFALPNYVKELLANANE